MRDCDMEFIRISLIIATVILVTYSRMSKGSTLQAATRKKFNSQVAVHYKKGIASYNSLVTAVQSDLDAAPDIDHSEYTDLSPKKISASAKRAAKRFQSHLATASRNCRKLVKELDSNVLAKSNDISKIEAKIRLGNKDLAKARSEKDGSEKAVNLAEQNVKSKERDVRTSEESKHYYWWKLKKTKNKCGKGWILQSICKAINHITGDYKKAARRFRRARNNLEGSRNMHTAALNSLRKANEKYNAALKKKKVLCQQQADQLISIRSAKWDRFLLNYLNAKMRKSLMTINKIKGGADNLKLQTDVGYYLDVDNVVIPLKEIGETIARLSGKATTSGFLPKLTDKAMKQSRVTKAFGSVLKMIDEKAFRDKIPSADVAVCML